MHNPAQRTDKFSPNQIYDFVIQRHLAERAGPHYDLRIGNPNIGLYSWATKKELPEAGKRIGVFPTPVHNYHWGKFEGAISSGRGKGTVRKHFEGKVLVSKADKDHLHFTDITSKTPKRYALFRNPQTNPDSWLLVRANTPTKTDADKVKFSLLNNRDIVSKLKGFRSGDVMQPKVDGALNIIRLLKDKIEVHSYRNAKETGEPIVHTERFFQGYPTNITIPSKYVGSVLYGEVYGQRNNKIIPVQDLGGILNSKIHKSITDQKNSGTSLKAMLFDVRKVGRKDVHDLPYLEKEKFLKEIIKHLPAHKFALPETAKTQEAAVSLLKKVREGQHPLTNEGVVIRTAKGDRYKYKLTEEKDVYIRKFFPGENKYKGIAVGGFYYSLQPNSDIVGKVGAGISDKLRKDMHDDPSAYINSIARIRAQGQYPSGAYRAPALIAIHEG